MSNNKGNGFRRFVKEKGYYIVLLLCAVTVGVSGYLLLRNKPELVAPSRPTTETRAQTEAKTETQTATQAHAGRPPELADVVATEAEPKPTETTAPPTEATRRVVRPVEGETANAYSMEALTYNPTTRDWRTHDGLDLAAEVGAQVSAAMDGTVYAIYDDDSLGTTVVMRHSGGYTTHYANLEQNVPVKVGDTLGAGDPIGTVGGTAGVESAAEPHLHFAVFLNNASVDPEEFLEGAES